MRRKVSGSAIAVILALFLGYGWAQGPGLRGADEPRAPDFPVALVDLDKVFKGYKLLSERNDELRRSYQKSEEAAKALVAEIAQLQEELKKLKPGTAEHQRLAETLQGKAKEFEAYRKQEQERLVEEQFRNHLHAYERISQEIQQYAESRGIRLVLRLNAPPAEGQTSQEKLNGLNRTIIYHNISDITDDILQALN